MFAGVPERGHGNIEPPSAETGARMRQVEAVCKFHFIPLLEFWGQIIECGTSRLSNEFPSRQHAGNHHKAMKQRPVGGSQC